MCGKIKKKLAKNTLSSLIECVLFIHYPVLLYHVSKIIQHQPVVMTNWIPLSLNEMFVIQHCFPVLVSGKLAA
jgi:hypothetical protein